MTRSHRVGLFYLLLFGGVGVTLPFLPAYLKSLSLSGAQIGLLLGLTPLMTLVAPPIWGAIADRGGRADRVLTALSLGMAVCFGALIGARSFLAVAVVLGAYAVFASSTTPIADSLALHVAASEGHDFAHVRIWGSIGFVIVSALYGVSVHQIGPATIVAGLVAMVLTFAASWALPRGPISTVARASALPLLRDRRLLVLLCGTTLHWIALAPFQSMYALHVEALALPPWVTGSSWAVGVTAEVCVLFLYPRLARALDPNKVFLASCLLSVVRWIGTAIVSSGPALIALSALHGATFGAFYVAAVSLVNERTPVGLRASGQALFAAATFGVGGVIGYVGAGAAFDAIGSRALFLGAAAVDLLAAVIAWQMTVRARSPASPAVPS